MARNQTAVTGPNTFATLARAEALHGKQHGQDHQRDRHDIVLEGRRHDLQAFDRRKHRDRRRDDGVAEEQRRAADADGQDRTAGARIGPPAPAPSATACRPRRHCRRAARRSTYLMVTMMVSAQTISDSTPSTSVRVAARVGRWTHAAPRGRRRSGWCRCRHRRRRARPASGSWCFGSERCMSRLGGRLYVRFRGLSGPSKHCHSDKAGGFTHSGPAKAIAVLHGTYSPMHRLDCVRLLPSTGKKKTTDRPAVPDLPSAPRLFAQISACVFATGARVRREG